MLSDVKEGNSLMLTKLTPVATLLTIHDASGQRDAVKQIVADRLPVFQRKKTDRICGRVARFSISSFVTTGLWPRSGYRGGRVSETKGNALAWGRPH